MTSRRVVFACIVAICVTGTAAYVAVAGLSAGAGRNDAKLPPAAGAVTAGGERGVDPSLRILVRAVDPENPRGNGRLYTFTPGGKPKPVGGRSCARVAAGGDRIVCLYLASTGVDYRAALIDRRTRSTTVVGLTGLPSRARVSSNGRLGAWTTFVAGDSYRSPGQFSTRTVIVDLASGRVIGDLEQFSVSLNGEEIDAVDRNFWGVTFAADNNTFYVTMATGGHHYLVRGDLRARSGTVLRDDVECPSLSPDGTRIGYKHPLGNGRWRLHVLDLRNMKDHPLAEARSIDDQVAWLDGSNIAYSDGTGVWTVPASGAGRPRLLLHDAASPTPAGGI
jgi:hypothetical protein